MIGPEVRAFVDLLGQCDPTADFPDVLRLCAAYDRTGVYDVYLEKPGYGNWSRLGVRAEERNECDVLVVRVEVLLQQSEY